MYRNIFLVLFLSDCVRSNAIHHNTKSNSDEFVKSLQEVIRLRNHGRFKNLFKNRYWYHYLVVGAITKCRSYKKQFACWLDDARILCWSRTCKNGSFPLFKRTRTCSWFYAQIKSGFSIKSILKKIQFYLKGSHP